MTTSTVRSTDLAAGFALEGCQYLAQPLPRRCYFRLLLVLIVDAVHGIRGSVIETQLAYVPIDAEWLGAESAALLTDPYERTRSGASERLQSGNLNR